jgi:hypothetical protein
MNRLKAVYRSWAIPYAGQTVYAPRYRSAWLEKLQQAGGRRLTEIRVITGENVLASCSMEAMAIDKSSTPRRGY